MSEHLLTYVIPTRSINESLEIHVTALINTYKSFDEPVPRILVFGKDVHSSNFAKLNLNIEVFEQNGSPFTKLVAASRKVADTQYVVFSTADDLTFFSTDDVRRMALKRARIGVGHFLLCRPTDSSRFRLFRGWTHFAHYMGTEPNYGRFNRYIGEGPHSVWGCYERDYFCEVANAINHLLTVLHSNELALIEDIINLLNLLVYDHHCGNSASLRFLDGNYKDNKSFIPSWIALNELAARGSVEVVCSIIKSALKRLFSMGAATQILSIEQIFQALYKHTDGYKCGKSRKWREWLDVDWRPFEARLSGVSQSTDSLNPYLNSFVWSGKIALNEEFPPCAWISNQRLRQFIAQVPDRVWRTHSIRI